LKTQELKIYHIQLIPFEIIFCTLICYKNQFVNDQDVSTCVLKSQRLKMCHIQLTFLTKSTPNRSRSNY